MPMYATASVPPINSLPGSAQQVWYTDDASTSGKMAICVSGGTNYALWVSVLGTTPTFQRPSFSLKVILR